jgi:hypothetical protein
MLIRSEYFRRAGICVALALGCTWGAVAVLAQERWDSAEAEPGVRFTPGMARAFAGIYTRQVLKSRYEMADDKLQDAQELVARRFMQLAHNIDEPGGEFLERFIEEQLANQGRGGGGGFIPPTFGKEFAEHVLPLLPEIHDMVRGVAQDVRPMLPMKQQLKMAGDMMAFKTGVDAFEATMQKWASGEVTEYKDPFRGERRVEKDEEGQTRNLKNARNAARREIENPRSKRWETYVEKFKQLYALDAAQAGTADSILREYTQREERMLADADLGERVYQGRLWTNMSRELENSWMHPARMLIEDFVTETQEPWEALEESFKTRLESIPTTSQRRAAEQRVAGLLEEKGLQLPEVTP